MYPITKALKKAGNYVIGIVGARTKELLILQDEMRQLSNEFFVTTDDGSYGQKGFVSDVLKKLIADEKKLDVVYAIGPVPMMRVCSDVTRPHNIKTVVSLNAIMVDGTGMCGACRVSVGGKTKFTCVDGPEFDGLQVNWKELQARLGVFVEKEQQSMAKFIESPTH